jgi:hypothetical protein
LLSDNKGFLDIKDNVSVRAFKGMGLVANKIGDFLTAPGIIEVAVTDQSLVAWGGAVTIPKGKDYAYNLGLFARFNRLPSDRGNNVPQIVINAQQVANNLLLSGEGVGAQTYFEHQVKKQNDPPDWIKWTVRPVFSGPPSDTRPHVPIALWHELGHAWGNVGGGDGQPRSIEKTNIEACQRENFMRSVMWGPLGPNNAPRRTEAESRETVNCVVPK